MYFYYNIQVKYNSVKEPQRPIKFHFSGAVVIFISRGNVFNDKDLVL